MPVNQKAHKGLVFLSLFAACLWISCAKDIEYDDIEVNVAGPTAIAHFGDEFFYVLNSDFDQRYDTGSILVLDRDGAKIGSVNTPRLGTSLKVAGNVMIATYSSDVKKDAMVEVYSLDADPKAPKLEKSFPLKDSQPVNIALVEDYDFFAVTCSNGDLYIGQLNDDRSKSTLKLVRKYKYPRRAIYIDKTREMLFAFPTMDYGVSITRDERFEDLKTYITDEPTNFPNGIPDRYEINAEQRNFIAQRFRYQFVVYDIEAARTAKFPLKENEDVLSEMRFLYFNLKDKAGKADYPEDSDTKKKFYRTNFWAAIPDPTVTDDSAFLLSHRDPYAKDLKKGNDVIQVKIKGPASILKPSGDPLLPPMLDTYFEFTRKYGFTPEQPAKPFPAAIVAQKVGGKDVLLVNHFNNLNVTKEGAKFSLAQKDFGSTHARYELEGQPPNISYYEMAMMSDGRTLAGSFFGHMVLLFDVDPSTNITEAKVTEIK